MSMLISRRPCSLRISVAAASTAALAASLRGRPRLFGMTALLMLLILVVNETERPGSKRSAANESDWRPADAATGQDGHGDNTGRARRVGHRWRRLGIRLGTAGRPGFDRRDQARGAPRDKLGRHRRRLPLPPL